MKIVKSEEEIKSLLRGIKSPKFGKCEMLVATFQTTPEFVREVLPAPLEPVEEAVGSLFLATWGASKEVGAFKGAALYITARYKDVVGDFCLTMPMNTDTAILYGRETMGEPKKQANTEIIHNGKKIIGTVERYGTEVMRIVATPTGLADPKEISEFSNFHFKYAFAADGSGLDHDPILVHVTFTQVVHSQVQACDIDLQLTKTVNDIYGDIPIVKVLKGWYAADLDMYAKSEYLTTVDKEAFLPYAFMKNDPFDDFTA